MTDLHWHDTGSGRPLVFLHGGFLDHRMWNDQIPAFAADYRVIAPDAPLHAVIGDLDSPDHIAMAERAVALAGTGTAHRIEGTAHYPNMERPDRFNALLRDLLHAL